MAFLSLWFLFFASTVKAQVYFIPDYGVKEGLVQSNVTGVVQDTAGFYWIATAGGVSRFDGLNFINYTTENGLPDNNVTSILYDHKHVLWLGHETGAVSFFDGTQFSVLTSTLLPADKKILSIQEDNAGNLWFFTEGGGAVSLTRNNTTIDGNRGQLFNSQNGLSPFVLSLTEDNQGTRYFLTDIGIRVQTKTGFDFFHPEGMPQGQVSYMSRLKNGQLLFGTVIGSVYTFDPIKKTFTTVLSPAESITLTRTAVNLIIYRIFEDVDQQLWISVLNTGVIRVKPNHELTWFNTTNGLAVNKIKSITQDIEGNILFGTVGEGIQVYSGERFIAHTRESGLIDSQVWTICEDPQGRFWFGTNGGITIFDPATNAYSNITTADGLPSNNIRAIVNDHQGSLWIAMWGGRVARYDLKTSKVVQVPALNEIVYILAGSLLVDKQNHLWIGSGEGIVQYNLTNGAVKPLRTIDGLAHNDVSCLYEDSKGRIWIGTHKRGVSIYDHGKFTTIDKSKGLNYNSISSICEDAKGRIWMGSEGGGVFVYDGKSFVNYKSSAGLASDFITLITRDSKNQMWLGTSRGLHRYDEKNSRFVQYGEGYGFIGLETKSRAAFKDSQGNLWFGTVKGVYRYSAKYDRQDQKAPLVKLIRARVNLKDYPFTDKLELSYKENNLSFDYIGISLSNPSAIYYQVQLVGFEDEPRITRNVNEVYPNLQPGKYTLRISACNGNGSCSNATILDIVISPPYWKTWWFFIIVLLCVFTGIFLYIKVRERALREEKRILEEKVQERTAEVVLKNKELDEINQDITASIRYAKRIQDAILPADDYVSKHLPNAFILFSPKDIVSGDFYWMDVKEPHVMFAAVDCTGHGVPGAFMSIVGHNLLDRAVNEQHLTEPALILNELNRTIGETLRQPNDEAAIRDGMDIALCTYNKEKNLLQYAGAHNPLWLIRNGELIEFKADKMPIGITGMEMEKFVSHEIQLKEGDTIYIFSDGYADQFGGPSGKKFKSGAFKKLLLDNQHLSMPEQKSLLHNAIMDWRGPHDQVDDVLVMGCRFTVK